MAANLHMAGVPISMLQPGVVLPSQYFAPHGPLAPERRLMIAVLHDAIDCVEKYRHATTAHGRRRFDEARQWVLTEETDWPYSFENICMVLALDANAVRRRLRLPPEQRPVLVTHQETSSRCARP